MKVRSRGILVSCLLALLVVAAWSQVPTGTITGTVSDESGAIVPGAKITATFLRTGYVRQTASDSAGLFSLPALLSGDYEVRCEAAGFRVLTRSALVETGRDTLVDLPMQVGTTTESVTVEAANSQISYESHKIDGVVTRRQIEALPLNGRSFLQLAFLEPGVTVAPARSGQYNDQFNVSILGGSSARTRLTVDGTSVVNSIEGGSQQNFSQEVVGEFQISTVNFDLSTGVTSVGAVNIVTRGGGNELHGSGYYFFRDHNMAAFPALRRDANNP
ncbi:MAG: carboxypeptidase regulatory-like domain-containing protein, partial [Bryobacteraceae bacterium]